MHVAWVGTGAVADAFIARLLAAGHSVTAAGFRGGSGRPTHDDHRVGVADSPHEAVTSCDVLVTFSEDADAELVQLFEGTRPLGDALPHGALWIDLSVCGPDIARRQGELLRERDVDSIDAPFVGWAVDAAAGRARFFAGGSEEACERASELLAVLGSGWKRVGDRGSGQVVTVCDRILLGTILVAQSESRIVAARQGLADARYRRATADGSSNQILNHLIEDQPVFGRAGPGDAPCSVGDIERVMRTALATAGRGAIPTAITAQAWKIYAVACNDGLRNHSLGDVLATLAGRAGLDEDTFLDVEPEPPDERGHHGGHQPGREIGLIGLGTIGWMVAEGLVAAGYSLVAHDLRTELRERVLEVGGQWEDSPRAVAERCDIVLTSLPGPQEVEAAVLGADGVLAGMSGSSTLVEMTTSDPDLTRRLDALARERGARVVDAAVSRGGPQGGPAGKFALWIGAEKAAVPHLVPLLETLGDKLTYCGETGLGQAVKVCNNYVSQVSDAIVGETYVLAAACGVEPLDLYDAIFPDSAGALLFGRRWPQCALVGNWKPRLRLVLGRKDLGLGIELATRESVPLSVGPPAFEVFSEALSRGYGDYDRSAIVMMLERAAGVRVVGTAAAA